VVIAGQVGQVKPGLRCIPLDISLQFLVAIDDVSELLSLDALFQSLRSVDTVGKL
jgi:hypothetical protein